MSIDLMPDRQRSQAPRARGADGAFDRHAWTRRPKNLSGGERARLLLGLITFGGPGMLILDEPTNHLDIDSRDALVAALNDYEGAVLIISHDRHLIDATVDQIWIAEDGTVKHFDGDMDSLPAHADRRRAEFERAAIQGRRRPVRSQARSGRRRRRGGRSWRPCASRSARLSKRFPGLEPNSTRSMRGSPNPRSMPDANPEDAIRLGKDKARFEAEIAEAEESWLEVSTALEDAEAAQAAET